MVCDNLSVGEVMGSTHRGSAVPKGQTVSVCEGRAAVTDEIAVSEAVATCRVGTAVAVPGTQRTRMTAINSEDETSKTFLTIFFMVLSKFIVRKDDAISNKPIYLLSNTNNAVTCDTGERGWPAFATLT